MGDLIGLTKYTVVFSDVSKEICFIYLLNLVLLQREKSQKNAWSTASLFFLPILTITLNVSWHICTSRYSARHMYWPSCEGSMLSSFRNDQLSLVAIVTGVYVMLYIFTCEVSLVEELKISIICNTLSTKYHCTIGWGRPGTVQLYVKVWSSFT